MITEEKNTGCEDVIISEDKNNAEKETENKTAEEKKKKPQPVRKFYAEALNGDKNAKEFLDFIYEAVYEKKNFPQCSNIPVFGLYDFDCKKIKINSCDRLAPIDVRLKNINGKNILTIDVNLSFRYSAIDGYENSEEIIAAVKKGIKEWEGDYVVFGGQPLTVKINVTTEDRVGKSVQIVFCTDEDEKSVFATAEKIVTKKKRELLDDIYTGGRSVAIGGLRWHIHLPKVIYLSAKLCNLGDFLMISQVAKHEFGHVLGLGDLYKSAIDCYSGVGYGTFRELDSYLVYDKCYYLIMNGFGAVSNNDIEMVILAFVENRLQRYQPDRLGSRISKALGRGN